MDPRLLEYYNRELQFAREMGAQFAQTYPRIAARLGLEGLECADPYVERLLEGFAFLAARVQLKLDARHPEFTQHLLELIYPHFLCPVPSCAVIELSPDFKEGSLQTGRSLARGTSLRTALGAGDRTAVEFRTAQETTLWPLVVSEARYLSSAGALSTQGVVTDGRARAAIRLRLKAPAGVNLKSLPADSLMYYIKATPDIARLIYEQIVADCFGFYARSTRSGAMVHFRPATSIRQPGLEDEEALLPVTHRSFQGYRLLQEYFAFPERFLFFSLHDLRGVFEACDGEELEIFLAMSRAQQGLENALDASQFRLHCVPAVNLFPRAADRIHVTGFDTEYHLIPDRNRPMDFEVFSIEKLQSIAVGGESVAEIHPFYSATHRTDPRAPLTYYTMQRRLRQLSMLQRHSGTRTTYIGSECFVSIVDSAQRQVTAGIRQIDAQILCTNRDLPIQLTVGQGETDFLVEGGAPVVSARCIAGPSYPRASPAFGDTAWKLISHLSLNYLSLIDSEPDAGAQMLRSLLSLYADANDTASIRQIEGVRRVSYEPVVRRMPIGGPIAYGRGLGISLILDDEAFEGVGIVVLASVLDRFFARYVSLNSFTQTRLQSVTRGEVKTWPVRLGRRPIS